MASNDSITDVFVYGTLMFPQVMEAVTGKSFDGQKAKLHNFAAYMVIGDIYPGIWHLDGVDTEGTLYHGIEKSDLAILDRYEGEEYNREILTVETEDGETQQAWVYIFRPAYRHLLSTQPWSAEKFRKDCLDDFLAELV